jgi:hypothetical protein
LAHELLVPTEEIRELGLRWAVEHPRKEEMLMRKVLLVVALALLTAPATALADTIQTTASPNPYGWQTWSSSNLNQNGNPYWDNITWDGDKKNIGYCLTGTGNCLSMPDAPLVPLPFWGASFTSSTDTGGGFDPNFFFAKDTPGSTAALKIEIAGFADKNTFGWFETDPTGTSVVATHELFSGLQGAGAAATFTPTLYYGFYLTTPQTNTFYTLSSQGDNPGMQHFAVFRGPGESYWLGMEDLKFGGCNRSDKDYNDMVVYVAPVPEPATLTLFGTGLIGLAGLVRRRLKPRS